MNVIECKRVKFFSSLDEAAFFEWLEKIKSVIDVKGKKDSLLLTINPKKLSNNDLHNLTALFRRYKIPAKKLECIVNDKNREVFEYFKHGYSINVYPVSCDGNI